MVVAAAEYVKMGCPLLPPLPPPHAPPTAESATIPGLFDLELGGSSDSGRGCENGKPPAIATALYSAHSLVHPAIQLSSV